MQFFFNQLRLALMIDSMIMFSHQIHQMVGKNINRLFGIDGVSLRNTEIFVDGKKGINCSTESVENTWKLGNMIASSILNVRTKKKIFGNV